MKTAPQYRFRVLLHLLLAFGLASPLFAQQKPQDKEKIYQLSGMVLDRENSVPIAFCKLATLQKKRLAITNEDGFFSIPVVAGDTLVFQRFGYKQDKLAVSDYLKEYEADSTDTYLYLIQYLIAEDFMLDTITVQPYNTPTELRTAILNMPTTTRLPVEAANRHVSAELLNYFFGALPDDKDDRIMIAQQRYIDYYSKEKAVAGGATVADPVAIINFIKYINTRNQDRRDENRRRYTGFD